MLCLKAKETRLVALNGHLSDATAEIHTCSTDWQVMLHQQETVSDDNNENVHLIENIINYASAKRGNI